MNKYLGINSIFALLIYVGFYSGLDNGFSTFAAYIVYAGAWVTGLSSLFLGVVAFDALVELIRQAMTRPNAKSHILDVLYDIAIIIALAGAEVYVTAVVYAIHVIIFHNGYTSAHKLYLKEQN